MIFIDFRGLQGVLGPGSVLFIDSRGVQGILEPESMIFIDFSEFPGVLGPECCRPVGTCGIRLGALKSIDMTIGEGSSLI